VLFAQHCLTMYFPAPYPDELTGSLLIRASHHLGATPRELRRLLSESERPESSLWFLGPSMLPAIARRACVAPHELLWSHTIFPYLCVSLDAAQAGRLELRLTTLSTAKDTLRLVGTYPQDVQVTPFRRFCKQCCIEERKRLGESYWHVSHALPGVAVCPVHGLMLHVCPIRLLPNTINQHNVLPQEVIGVPAMLATSHAILQDIAKESYRALRTRPDEQLGRHGQYGRDAASVGYDFSRYSHDRYRVASDLEGFFGRQLLGELGVPVRSGAPTAWPLALLDGHQSVPQAQLKHILLRVFLMHRVHSAARLILRELPARVAQGTQP
jgi:TniQ